MQKGTARLIMIIGGVAYVALMALQLMTQLFSVSFFSFASIAVAVQVAIGLPVLGYLFAGMKIPIVDYAKWLVLVVSVLAVSGTLGVGRRPMSHDSAFRAEQQSLREDAGELEKLELAVDLAEADDDDERKEIQAKIKKVDDEISADEKKKLRQKADVLKAENAVADFKRASADAAITAAADRHALIVLAVMLVLAGAIYEQHEGPAGKSES